MHGTHNRNQRPKRRSPPGTGTGGSARPRPNSASTNPQCNYERFMALAREAIVNGDPIEAENCYQHAEHYFRVLRGE
jgi:hypothetical protein